MIIEIEDDIGATYTYEIDDNKPVNICSCDVDGTLSSGVIYMDNGRIARQYNMRDGAGLRNLVHIPNTVVLLISGESDRSIWDRAMKLQIPFFHAPGRNKVPKFNQILTSFSLFETNLYHIGDDTNDLELLKISKVPSCPLDAHHEILRFVEQQEGYLSLDVRDWCDWLSGELQVADH